MKRLFVRSTSFKFPTNSHYHFNHPSLQRIPNRKLFQWTNNNIIEPIYGVCQHIANYPLNFVIGFASIAFVSLGLRKLSRRLMYFPHTEFMTTWKTQLKNVDYDEITFKSKDNTELYGWYIHGNNNNFSKYPLLFLHGNAGNISHRIDNLLLLNKQIGCDVFIFDYRGYGKSCKQTKPTQNGLIDDSISALYKLISIKQQKNITEVKPILFGRSLGGAVAFHLLSIMDECKDINIGGCIIENTFTTVWDVVGNNLLYPFIVDKWNNIKCIQTIKDKQLDNIPILYLSAVNDTILNSEMMTTLRDLTKYKYDFTNVNFKEFHDGDHNDTFLCDGYSDTILSFIQSMVDEDK